MTERSIECYLVQLLLHSGALASKLLDQLQLALNDLHLVRLLRESRLQVRHLLLELVDLKDMMTSLTCQAIK